MSTNVITATTILDAIAEKKEKKRVNEANNIITLLEETAEKMLRNLHTKEAIDGIYSSDIEKFDYPEIKQWMEERKFQVKELFPCILYLVIA